MALPLLILESKSEVAYPTTFAIAPIFHSDEQTGFEQVTKFYSATCNNSNLTYQAGLLIFIVLLLV